MKYKLSFFVSSATFRALTRSSYIQIMTESHKIKRSYDVQLSFLLWLQQYVTEMGCTLDVGLVVLHFTHTCHGQFLFRSNILFGFVYPTANWPAWCTGNILLPLNKRISPPCHVELPLLADILLLITARFQNEIKSFAH